MSIVFWTDTWRPESFFDKVKKNRENGMHTLCLLGKHQEAPFFSCGEVVRPLLFSFCDRIKMVLRITR